MLTCSIYFFWMVGTSTGMLSHYCSQKESCYIITSCKDALTKNCTIFAAIFIACSLAAYAMYLLVYFFQKKGANKPEVNLIAKKHKRTFNVGSDSAQRLGPREGNVIVLFQFENV